jgi:FAD/FMN-containing dehydrogenase
MLTGWGGQGVPALERRGEDLERLVRGKVLSRGLGRAYGDAALPPPGVHEVAGTCLADRILRFDEATGSLTAEAGLSLTALRKALLPRGWFVPVSPGTQYVTLGGMVAADVHGKNHHVAGTIGRHVTGLRIATADGRILQTSREVHGDLFRATLGGMGLCGHILDVTLTMEKVPTPWILEESERIADIDGFLEGLDRAAAEWPMTVGWIDCLATGASLGRGILIKGRWATPSEAPAAAPEPPRRWAVPVEFPGWALNDASVRAFNVLYYWRHLPQKQTHLRVPDPFFWPLDAIRHWNRMYGSRGFTQHQCVLPREAGRGAVRRYVELLARRGGASFLCVIKDCGPEGDGLLSFPMPGTSVALDLPCRPDTPALVAELNRFVIEHGGRIYLAKDSFTRAEDFRAMEGARLDRFLAVRRSYDPGLKHRSALSHRLGLDSLETP